MQDGWVGVAKDVKALWDALLSGEPEHDESIQITSADVNRQTADRLSEISKKD
jgi:hypothetical protein